MKDPRDVENSIYRDTTNMIVNLRWFLLQLKLLKIDRETMKPDELLRGFVRLAALKRAIDREEK